MIEGLGGLVADALAAALPQGFGGFASPAWLLLLVVVALGVGLAARARPAAIRWPALAEARTAGAGSGDLLRWLALGLRTLALVALVLVLARPVTESREVRDRHEGLDMVLVVDASGSMRALDAQVDGQWHTRFDLAREVVARFGKRRVAAGDRVGLVVFGDSAFTQCPLTSDGDLLRAALDRVEPGIAGEATALGDALALAVKRVAPEGEEAGAQGPAAGRLVVLLTDGRANAGAVPSEVAASLAAQLRTRVHTVGIGSRGEVAMAHPNREGAVQFERHDLDPETLELIARSTGGRFFHARASADLEAVYAEIDALERVERPAPPRVSGAPAPEPFLALAGGLLLLELLVARIALRPLP